MPLPLRIAALLLPRDVREEVLGDLVERWNQLGRERSPFARHALAWRQPFVALAARVRYGPDAKGEVGSVRGRHSRFSIPDLRFSWIDVKLGARMPRKHPGPTLVSLFAPGVAIPVGLAPWQVARVAVTVDLGPEVQGSELEERRALTQRLLVERLEAQVDPSATASWF